MADERGLPPQEARQLEPVPEPGEQGHHLLESEGAVYPDDIADADGHPGAECSSYIPRYATS